MGVCVCVCWPGPLLVIAKICMQLAHTDSPIDSDKNFLPSPCESLCVCASGCVRVCGEAGCRAARKLHLRAYTLHTDTLH